MNEALLAIQISNQGTRHTPLQDTQPSLYHAVASDWPIQEEVYEVPAYAQKYLKCLHINIQLSVQSEL